MTRFLAAALLATCAPVALADSFEAAAPIAAVDIYPDGAILQRRAQLDLPAGAHEVTLTNLPPAWDMRTLGLEISAGARMTSLTLQTDAEDAAIRARLDAIKARLEALDRQLDQAAASAETTRAEFAMVERFMADPQLFAERQDATEFWAYLVARHGALQPLLTAAASKSNQLQVEKTSLQAQDQELRPQLAVWHIKIGLVVDSAGSLDLAATYYTPQASWQTSYDIALDTAPDAAQGQVTLVHNADIYQSTGEDWQGVSARLHSNRAQRPIYAPALFTWHVAPKGGEAKGGNARLDLSELTAADIAPAPLLGQATVSTSAYNAVYDLAQPLTLASTREETQKVLLEQAVAPAELWAQTTAEISDQATLMARVDSTLGVVGLPGAAKFYRDGSLIGQGHMAALVPGASVEIPFGIDPLIEIQRVLDADEAGDRGFIGRLNTLKRSAITTVTNNHPFAMPIRALEATPVPLHEDIELTVLRGSTAFDLEDVGGQKGVMAWTPEIAPGASLQLIYSYQLSWPDDMYIGL